MARVSGPLFSMSASGTIGKALTYGAWKGIAWVRSWFTPENPQTAKQVNVRAALTLLVAKWQTLEAGTKESWETFAEGTGMSGYNQFCRRGMNAYVLDPGVDVPPVAVNVTGLPPDETWTWNPV